MRTFAWLLVLNGFYAAILAAMTLLNMLGPDRYWLGALNLYLPQVMWAVPGAILLPVTFKSERSLAWLPLLCVIWVLGPVMGYNRPSPARSAEASGRPLRVLSWNIKYGRHDLRPLIEEVERSRPDVVLFQDAVGAGKGPLADYFGSWQVRSQGQYFVASRYPILAAEVHELPYYGRKKEWFQRCRVRVGDAQISLYNVHFKTPRRSLNAFRKAKRGAWYIPEAVDRFERNVAIRLAQAETVAGYLAREKGAVILGGDLNAPDASLVCARLREPGLEDAFAQSGRGYGYTYGHFLLKNRLPWLRTSWMRIDHVMTNSALTSRSCRVGTGKASDHKPVIADLVLKSSAD